MANTTFRAACERVLTLSGRAPFASDSEFNGSVIDSEKAALKEFFRIANQMYGRTQRGRSLRREFYLDTANNDNDYPLDTKTSVDRLVPKSWYISTTDKGGPLAYYPGGYYQWKRDYPEGESLKGRPRYWFDLPATDTDTEHVGFSPPPDAVYRVYYSGYLRPIPLGVATDELIFPKEFEDGIILAALSFLALFQAEGKHPDIQAMLEPVFASIEQNNMGALDEIHGWDLGIQIDAFGAY